MKKHKKNNLKFLILVGLLATSCISKENVDLIIHNGTIYTLNAYFDIDEAIAIKEGKILASGKNNQILNKYTSAKTIDLKEIRLSWFYRCTLSFIKFWTAKTTS